MKQQYTHLLCIVLLFSTINSYGQILINEVSNNNGSVILDEAGKAEDWIELYNSGSVAVNIQHYAITDDSSNLLKWRFPAVNMPPRSFLVVFASDKDTIINTNIHLNFKLSKQGEMIILCNPGGAIIDRFRAGILQPDHSMGRSPDGDAKWCFFKTPTPKASNSASSCYSGYEPDPIFSQDAGFYKPELSISLSANSPTGTIKYTLTGDIPLTSHATYSAPLKIEKTRVLAARTFSSGNLLPSNTVKKTYFIGEDSLDLPVISISINPGDIWDTRWGIYVMGPNASPSYPYFGANFWQEWERLCHVEYFDKHKKKQFEADAGIRIFGGYSRGYPQKSFRFNFRKKYGTSEIQFPLIPDKPHIKKYKSFVTRNAGQDYYGSRFRDAGLQRVVKKEKVDYMSYEPAIVFLNGEYWGEYELRERQNDRYFEGNYGIPPEEIDLLVHTGSLKVRAGSDAHFYQMLNYIKSSDPKDPHFLSNVNKLLDVENFSDYFIIETYYGNGDWLAKAGGNNVKLWHHRVSGGRWRYMLWDLDQTLGMYGKSPSTSTLAMILNRGTPIPHIDILKMLLKNTQFKTYFINRYADLINTVFQPGHMEKVLRPMKDSIRSSMPRHIKKWGSSLTQWNKSLEDLLKFNANRIGHSREHVRQQFNLKKQVDVTLKTLPENAGRIRISTIIPDSLPWKGVYFDGAPVTITAIPNAGFTFSHWETNKMIATPDTNKSAITLNIGSDNSFTAHFTGGAANPKLAFSEINYHSDPSMNSGDWIEVYNYGTIPVDLTGWKIKDDDTLNVFEIPFGTILQPNGRMVFVNDTQKFISQYPTVKNYRGQMTFAFKNSGERINLYDHRNVLQLSATYDDSIPWPKDADGHGKTLELKDPEKNLSESTNWFSGCMGGSPGQAFSPCSSPIVFSEINYNSPELNGSGDWVELHNLTTSTTDLSHWTFKDSKDSNEYKIPANTVLTAYGYLVICNDSLKFSRLHPGVRNFTGTFNFKLAEDGELIRLYDRSGRIQISMSYDDSIPWPTDADGKGKTLELINPRNSLSQGQNWFSGCLNGSPGKAYATCNPAAKGKIIFSEINYHAQLPEEAGDWVELFNLDSLPVDLSGWTFGDSNGVRSFIIPPGSILLPDSYLILAGDIERFRKRHPGISNIAGPFGFDLSSGGDLISLKNLQGEVTLFVKYGIVSPWPPVADIKGRTLELLDYGKELNNAANWFFGCPGGSPGTAFSPVCLTGIEPASDSAKLSIIPNPSSSVIVIEIVTKDTGWNKISLKVYDAKGNKVRTISKINSNKIIMNKEDYSAGVYTILITNEKGESLTERIIFE